MRNNRMLTLFALLAVPGFAACGGGEEPDAEMVTEEVVTQPEVEQVEVPVMTEDTAIVRREAEVNVNVDTIDVEGTAGMGADTLQR